MAIYFSIWIAFGNFYDPSKEEIIYGIDTHQRSQKSTMNLKFIKNIPFKATKKEINQNEKKIP
jgi:hypothetical protein